MARCPHRAAEVPAGSRYCPGCGTVQSSVSQAPTAVGPPAPSGAGPQRSGSPAQIGRLAFALDD